MRKTNQQKPNSNLEAKPHGMISKQSKPSSSNFRFLRRTKAAPQQKARLHAHLSYVCIVDLLVYSFLKLIYVSASYMFGNSRYFYMSLACLMFTQNSIKETSLHKVLSCLNIASTPLFRTIREVNNTITI